MMTVLVSEPPALAGGSEMNAGVGDRETWETWETRNEVHTRWRDLI